MRGKVVTVFGGAGFIGRYVVQRLAEQGAIIRVPSRHTARALFLKPLGGVGQINVLIEPLYGAVAAKVIVLLMIVGFLQWRPEGLYAVKGRRK